MEVKDIFAAVDHTLLRQTATWEEVRGQIDAARAAACASVCISPCYVARAAAYLASAFDAPVICTVVGFPNGASTVAAKCFEAAEAVQNGAGEIDMVINLGLVRANDRQGALDEINAVADACGGRLLKVIVETCLLTEDEKLWLCDTVSRSRAGYIKTSTGFAGGGATLDDVRLMAANVFGGTKVKAAGGISTLAQAEELLLAGASRIGASRLIAEAGKLQSKGE